MANLKDIKIAPAPNGVLTEGVIGLDGEVYDPMKAKSVGARFRPDPPRNNFECGVYGELESKEQYKKMKKPKIKPRPPGLTTFPISNPEYDQRVVISDSSKEEESTAPSVDTAVYLAAEECGQLALRDNHMDQYSFGEDVDPNPTPNPYLDASTWWQESDYENINKDEEVDDHIYESLDSYNRAQAENASVHTYGDFVPHGGAIEGDEFADNSFDSFDREPNNNCARRVIDELIRTEEEYLNNLNVIVDDIKTPLINQKLPPHINIEAIFSNIEDIRDFSSSFYSSLITEVDQESENEAKIARVFFDHFESMEKVYTFYCGKHDTVIALMKKYETEKEFQDLLHSCLDVAKDKVNTFDLGSFLIKPVQRVLKYPLLLKELRKAFEDSEFRQEEVLTDLVQAEKTAYEMAKTINEAKRAKDLVNNYLHPERQLPKKTSDQLHHAIIKKKNRISMKIGMKIGLTKRDQIVDEEFNQAEHLYRVACKRLKNILEDFESYLKHSNDVIEGELALVESFLGFFASDHTQSLTSYETAMKKVKEFFTSFRHQVQRQVLEPLRFLAKRMLYPEKIITKRNDKLLDYAASMEGGDTNDRSQTAKNVYEALNQQLLNDLPKLCDLGTKLLETCLSVFIQLQLGFYKQLVQTMEPVFGMFRSNDLISSLQRKEILTQFNIAHHEVRHEMKTFTIIPTLHPDEEAVLSIPTPVYQSYCSLHTLVHNQSSSEKRKLLETYAPEDLYVMKTDYSSFDKTDISCSRNDVIGVIKRQHPLGNKKRWYCDNGASKGFLPYDALQVYTPPTEPNYEAIPTPLPAERVATPSTSTLPKTPSLYSIREGYYDFSPRKESTKEYEYEMIPDIASLEEIFDVEDEMLDDTEYGVFDGGNGKKNLYKVEFQFLASNALQLSVKKGDAVTVLIQHDHDGNTDWFYVSDRNGKQGFVPSNYLSQV